MVHRVSFGDGPPARLVRAAPHADADALLRALGVPDVPAVLWLSGGAAALQRDAALRRRLVPVFHDALAPAVVDAGALVVDGGTDAGAMALMGTALAAHAPAGGRLLLGVAPAGLVVYPGAPAPSGRGAAPLEPHHAYFALAETDDPPRWGDELPLMAALAEAARHRGGGTRPGVLLLVGGGGGSAAEVRRARALGWPVVPLRGSGGHADRLAADAPAPGDAPSASVDDAPAALRRRLAALLTSPA